MSEVIDWSQFGSGAFVKFDQIGTKVEGTITALRSGEDFNGRACPVLDIDEGGESRSVTCGQANLKAQITQLGREQKLRVGQRISITYARDEKADKGMKKVFDVKLDGDAGATAPPF